MSEKLNIYQRVIKVREAQGGYVKKDKKVSYGNTNYNAVTHDHITEVLRPHLNANGIVIVPNLIQRSRTEIIKEGRAAGWLSDSLYQFKFVNADDPSDFFTVDAEAYGIDSSDKGPGKAFSMAKKYAMLKVFEIESGDDEEARTEEKPAPKKNDDALKKAMDIHNGATPAETTAPKKSESLLANIADEGIRNEVIALIQLHAARPETKMSKAEITSAIKAKWIDSQSNIDVFVNQLKDRFSLKGAA